MPADIAGLTAELTAEQDALDRRLVTLDADGWRIATPAAGWDVRDQVSHLCYFDQAALVALTDPPAFGRHAQGQVEAVQADPHGDTPDVALGRATTGPELLDRWRRARQATREAAVAAAAADPKARVPWYGPPMSVASFVTARLMETWAHGTDVADALGLAPAATDRLRHVCLIGIKARPYAFSVHGRTDPGDPVRFDVAAPGGDLWTWGPEDARDRVTGSALDLALLMTQRRHHDDTDLVVEGPTAEAWMAIAQAFAGGAGQGRPPASARVSP